MLITVFQAGRDMQKMTPFLIIHQHGYFQEERNTTTMVHQPSLPDDSDTHSPQNHADAALFIDLTHWREQLARSIARNNLGMRSKLIATAVNRVIISLMFLRIAEDRGFISKGMLKNIQNSYEDNCELGPILRPSLALYLGDPDNGQKSEDDLGDLVVEDRVLMEIFSALTSEDRHYNLAEIPLDILSQVFSRYLKKTIRRSATHHVDIIDTHDMTQSGGTTMHQIAAIEYMVTSSLDAVTKNRSVREILPIRLVDPACGSGSTLLSSYHWLLEHNGGNNLTIEECREILSSSIYGLDINRHAVAVTRMLLLFRLLEYKSEPSSDDFFSLSEQVFADLSRTIQCGNALISPEITHDESWMFCPPRKRHALNTFSWHKSFPEIFATGGFDAVISNPPEARLEDPEWIQQYFQRHYRVFHPLADLSVYFIEKGISLLRPGGTLSAIISNRWFRGSQGSPLRMLLKAKQIEEIVDSSVISKRKPGIAPCILLLSNRSHAHTFSVTLADVVFSTTPDEFRSAYRFPVDQTLLDDGGWTLTDTRVEKLLKKVNRNCLPLTDFVMGQVHAGIETGSCEGFVIGEEDRKTLVKKDSRNKKLIRKLMSANEVNRYYAGGGGHFIIFIPEGWTKTHPGSVKNPWQWFRQWYPVLAKYLKKLSEHTAIPKGGTHWWEISGDNNFWLVKKPKILFRHNFEKPVFAFNEGQAIVDSTVCTIASSSLYLLGLLNSRLLSFVFEKSVQIRSADLPVFSWDDLRMLPIYTPDFENPDDKAGHDRMVALSSEMRDLYRHLDSAKTEREKRLIMQEIGSTDKQIDSLVYGLYGLTAAEIAVVEESVGK
jgi:adenine-specific DNA-methyltransferase